jgi:peptidoglycan/xylan/chitin deacetylase (PgdA/CDA1 family)
MNVRQSVRDGVQALSRTAFGPVPLSFWERAFPKELIAFCYHVVSDLDLPHLGLYPYKNEIQFEADVRYARDRAISYERLRKYREGGDSPPSNSFLFTFDDGFAECHDVIRPILRRHGVDAVFFVTTDYLDDAEPFFECTLSLCIEAVRRTSPAALESALKRAGHALASRPARGGSEALSSGRIASLRKPVARTDPKFPIYSWLLGLAERDSAEIEEACELLGVNVAAYTTQRPIFMSRDQVARLAADGFTVGAHGLKHRSLESRDAATIEREIVASCEVVREITGQRRVPFAFPHSGIGIDRQVLADIVRRNEIVDMLFDSGCLRRDPSFIINRVFADRPTRDNSSNLSDTLRSVWSVPSAWFRAASSAPN